MRSSDRDVYGEPEIVPWGNDINNPPHPHPKTYIAKGSRADVVITDQSSKELLCKRKPAHTCIVYILVCLRNITISRGTYDLCNRGITAGEYYTMCVHQHTPTKDM